MVVRKPARFRTESSVGGKSMGGMVEAVGWVRRWERNFSRSSSVIASERPRMSSKSVKRTSPSPTADPPVPLLGITTFNITPALTNSDISLSVAVGDLDRACTCATETVAGKDLLKIKISAILVLLKPPLSGIGSNICEFTCWMIWATSRKLRSVANAVTRPRSSSLSPKKSSSSCVEISGFDFERWMGLRWVKDVNGEAVADRLSDGGLRGLLVMREECAAE